MTLIWFFVIGLIAFAYTLEPLFRKTVAASPYGKTEFRTSAAETLLDVNLEEAELDLALGKLTAEEYNTYVQQKAAERARLEDALEREIQKLRRKKHG